MALVRRHSCGSNRRAACTIKKYSEIRESGRISEKLAQKWKFSGIRAWIFLHIFTQIVYRQSIFQCSYETSADETCDFCHVFNYDMRGLPAPQSQCFFWCFFSMWLYWWILNLYWLVNMKTGQLGFIWRTGNCWRRGKWASGLSDSRCSTLEASSALVDSLARSCFIAWLPVVAGLRIHFWNNTAYITIKMQSNLGMMIFDSLHNSTV